MFHRSLFVSRFQLLALLVHACLSAAELAAAIPQTTDADGTPSPPDPGPVATATIVGKVTYQRDAARPWRLGRYYIKNARTGELAEAVVAISGRGLKASEGPREPVTNTVDQKDFQFTPETVAIRVGDRVRFLNNDQQIHNVRSSATRQAFNVNMPPGGEHTETFRFAGGIRQPYRIGCVYHSAMRAWIFVFDHPWFQVTDESGSFRLTNIPPGQYRLEVVHPAGQLRANQLVTLRTDEPVTLEFQLSPDDRTDEQN